MMELKILEESKKRMSLEITGVDHTFCNALKDQLWQEKGVTLAGYRIDHPQIGIPTLIVETDGSMEPKEALAKSIQKLNKELDKVSKSFSK